MFDSEKAAWEQIPSLELEMDVDYAKRIKVREGRKHHRMDISTLDSVLNGDVSSLPVRVATVANGVLDGMVLDLSETGCQISVPKELKKGELTRVGFIINERPVVCKAIAKWISPKDSGCTAGLEFREVPDNLKEFLGSISAAALLNRVGKIK